MSGRMSGSLSKILLNRCTSIDLSSSTVRPAHPNAETMKGIDFEKSGCIERQRLLYRIGSPRVRAGNMDRKALEEIPVA